ncbi:MAG: trigger factor [Nitrospirota bacterium]
MLTFFLHLFRHLILLLEIQTRVQKRVVDDTIFISLTILLIYSEIDSPFLNMLNILKMYTVEEISPIKKRFRIEIPKEVIEQETSDAYSRLNRKVKVPGFRPGHVPRQILEKQFSKNIEAEVIENLIPDYYLRSVRESGITPVENPTIEGEILIKKDSPLIFEATVEIKPTIEVKGYEGIEIERQSIDISEEDIEKTLKNIQESHARLEPFEESHTINNGDFCLISFEGFLGDKPIEGGNVQDYLVEIGSNVLVPGFEEQLIGSKKGGKLDIKVTFPEDYGVKDMTGKEGSFKVEIKEVKRKVLPDFDNEFAKDLGQNSISELRDKVKEEIEKEKKRIAERDQKDTIIKKLLETHSFEVPSSMVERELRILTNRRKKQVLQAGGSLEGIDENNLRTELSLIASERVKAGLILETIGKKENISVSDEDLNKRIDEISSELRENPEDIKKLYISKDGSLEGLRSEIFVEKTLDNLFSKVAFK